MDTARVLVGKASASLRRHAALSTSDADAAAPNVVADVLTALADPINKRGAYPADLRLLAEAALAKPDDPSVPPRVFPVGSREPEEKGLMVRGESDVIFKRDSFGRWEALWIKDVSPGDGGCYSWHQINGRYDGMVLTEVKKP